MHNFPQAVANLEAWLETMRGSAGYGGPVVHWWQNCLQFTGAGLDWRYEGIICGYLTLWRRTGSGCWLEKACRAGDDLLCGQLPSGNFRQSSFEQNPYAGGTPHEAAADVGLLALAKALRAEGDGRWKRYANSAEKNLTTFHLNTLWDKHKSRFRDGVGQNSFVPNKACTLVEALFALADLKQDDTLIAQYALPALASVLRLQVRRGRLHGAIAQAELDGRVIDAYFPYYIMRCVPALLLAYDATSNVMWRSAALAACIFVSSLIDASGLLPQVVYPKGENRFPQWLAPLGDVLRIFGLAEVRLQEQVADLSAMRHALMLAQLPSGGFATAYGFGNQTNPRVVENRLLDFRDRLPVVGWNDKTFRYLTTLVASQSELPRPLNKPWTAECHLRNKPAVWQESDSLMQLTVGHETKYFWHKAQPWASVSAPEVMWK